MKILRTAAEASAEKRAREKAYEEVRYCPECHRRMSDLDIGLPVISFSNEYEAKQVFIVDCQDCGCRYQSEEF